MPINCAAIPETLLESELFGHDKGAFTGAIERRQGCFELADRGTLFLDEVAEMSAATQVKLLRVLQERTFRRLGGRQEQSVDIRVIAATNVDVAAAVQSGRLREDLYYRLNVFEIRLPPLRERKADLALLVQAFIKEFNARNGRSIVSVDAEVLAAFEEYSWPGNVRELRNVIERATIVAEGPLIGMRDLPALLDHQRAPQSRQTLAPGHDRGRSRASVDSDDAGTHQGQQDPRRRDAGHQPEDPAQQARPVRTPRRARPVPTPLGDAVGHATDPVMRLTIKVKQVLGVVSTVGLATSVLTGFYVSSLVRESLEESKGRAELLANAIFHRASALVAAPDLSAALQEDEGLRSLLESSAAYSGNVVYAAIVDVDGVAIVHNDTERVGQVLPPAGEMEDLLRRSTIGQLRAIYSDSAKTLEVRKPLVLGTSAVRIHSDRRLDAADPARPGAGAADAPS